MVVPEDCPHNILNKPVGTTDKDESIILIDATNNFNLTKCDGDNQLG
jgi:hypothetical protein